MFRKKDAEVYYINERSRSASEELASLFSYCIQKDGRIFRELVFLCIGSDRITGDSLGPLIGYQVGEGVEGLAVLLLDDGQRSRWPPLRRK